MGSITKLVDAHYQGIVLVGDGNSVAAVVEVAMRAEHRVHLFDLPLRLRTRWVPHHPRIDQHRLATRRLDAESGVSKPGKFDSFQIHEFTFLMKQTNSSRGCRGAQFGVRNRESAVTARLLL